MEIEKQEVLNKLLTSLNYQIHPTIYLLSCEKKELVNSIILEIEKISKYKFYSLKIEEKHYNLRHAFSFLPEEIKKSYQTEYILSIDNISEIEKEKRISFIKEINFEREIIFQNYPFITILWVTPNVFDEFFYTAGDLMSWLVDKYEF